MTAFRNLDNLVKNMSDETLGLARRDHPKIFSSSIQASQSRRAVGRASVWKNEDEFMRACFDHLKIMEREFPELSMAYHVANENSHKRPGVRAGVLDIYIPVPRGEYNQLAIELKLSGGKLSQKQKETIAQLEAVGSCVQVVWDSLDEFVNIVRQYISSATKIS